MASIETFYGVRNEQLDFADNWKSADIINEWIEKITNGKVTSLVDPDSLPEAVMILINAIYFRGFWRQPFEKTITKEFFVEPESQANKEFVELTGNFHYFYSKNLSAKIIRLPYEGDRYSMFLLLPFENDGLDKFVEALDSELIKDEVNRMEDISVHVVLPKFKFDSSLALNNVIQKVRN